jgi:tetratricopeptide (TPR) repeat protein
MKTKNVMQHTIYKTIICLAAFTWLAGITQTHAQQQNSEELRRHIRYAQTAYNAGEYPDALKEYQEALELAPNYPELYKAIGDVYEKLATTADLKAAITHYKRYMELAPKAADVRQIQDKIYDLEYLSKKQEEQDMILDDLSGEWVALDNVEVDKIEEDGGIRFFSDFVFQISEIQKTGKYRITMLQPGNRHYSEKLIEKTINIVPAPNNSFTFTFAEAVAHTPNAGGYNAGRLLGRMLGEVTGNNLVSDLTEIAVSAAQESDLPSNTQTAYTFALQYNEGKLVGVVNVIGKFADPTRQQTTGNEMYEITFVKKDDKFEELLRYTLENKPDVINFTKIFKDKWGKKLSRTEIVNKLSALDPELGKMYHSTRNKKTGALITSIAGYFGILTGLELWIIPGDKNSRLVTTGQILFFSSLAIEIASISILIPAISKENRLIKQYNEQIIQQHKNKPTAELRFGITTSGGVGLTLNF